MATRQDAIEELTTTQREQQRAVDKALDETRDVIEFQLEKQQEKYLIIHKEYAIYKNKPLKLQEKSLIIYRIPTGEWRVWPLFRTGTI